MDQIGELAQYEPETRAVDPNRGPDESDYQTPRIEYDVMGADDLPAARELDPNPVEDWSSDLANLETRNEPRPPGSFLDDLETQNIDPEEMERAVRANRDTDSFRAHTDDDPRRTERETSARRTRSAIEPDTVEPAPRDEERERIQLPYTPPRRRRGRGKPLLAVVTLGAVGAGLHFTQDRWRPLLERATVTPVEVVDHSDRVRRLEGDVTRALASTQPLASDAPAVVGMRKILDELHEAGVDRAQLAQAASGLSALEGLLAVSRGDLQRAERFLNSDELPANSACLSAVSGALATVKQGERAFELLSTAIEGGIHRPEVHAWRAQAWIQGDLEDERRAATALQDLAAVTAATGTLSDEERVLQAHAYVALGRFTQAQAALEHVDGAPRELVWAAALGGAERSMEKGALREALQSFAVLPADEGVPGIHDPRAAILAKTALERAQPHLRALEQRPLELADQTELLTLLELARRLQGQPLSNSVTKPLLSAVREAAARRKPFPREICLALATVGTPWVKRRVLVYVYRRLYLTGSPTHRVELNLLLCLMVGVQGSNSQPGSRQDLLGGLQDRETQIELYVSRALALESLRRYRLALADISRAAELDPESDELGKIRARIAEALRAGPSGKGTKKN